MAFGHQSRENTRQAAVGNAGHEAGISEHIHRVAGLISHAPLTNERLLLASLRLFVLVRFVPQGLVLGTSVIPAKASCQIPSTCTSQDVFAPQWRFAKHYNGGMLLVTASLKPINEMWVGRCVCVGG